MRARAYTSIFLLLTNAGPMFVLQLDFVLVSLQ